MRKGPRTTQNETARVRALYDQMAPRYDAMITVVERMLIADGRRWACGQAVGRVLEVAIGTGRNLGCYPPEVDLVGIDVSPKMLDVARTRANGLSRRVELQVADAQSLPFEEATFDMVVATLTLCSIPQDRRALAEVARVLRPGGRLVLLDHVASPVRAVRAVQRVLDPLMVRFMGDHLLREPQAGVQQAGLVIDELTRSKWGIVARLRAHKPTATRDA